MIEKAAVLAQRRGWDPEILSPLRLAMAIPSRQWQGSHFVEIYCSVDARAWGMVMLRESSTMAERSEEVRSAVRWLRQFCKPAEFDLLPEPNCYIRYAEDLDIENEVESHLARAIDEALLRIDIASNVLQLVNWGDKSADAAIAQVTGYDLHGRPASL